MGKKVLSVAVSLPILLSVLSCAVRQTRDPLAWGQLREKEATEGAASDSIVQPCVAQQAPAAQALGQAQSSLPPPMADLQLPLNNPQTSDHGHDIASVPVTEALDRALDVLKRETRESEKLRQTIDTLQNASDEKEQTIKGLNSQLETYATRIKKLEDALGKWKEDVLGFRDEMRRAEAAEIGVLHEILALLRGLEQARESQ